MLALALDPEQLMRHVTDHPWPGWHVTAFGMPVTLMSSGIFTMLLVAAAMGVGIPLMARRRSIIPGRGQSVLEVIVTFIRDGIALPALREKAYDYLPFLTTLFLFIFVMNVVGLVPLESITLMLGVEETNKIGGTPTAVATLCGGLAMMAMVKIVGTGLLRAGGKWRRNHPRWPAWACAAASPLLWFASLGPAIPGLVGKAMFFPMAALELVSALAKCAALMVRLATNMVAGHLLLAVIMWIALESLRQLVARTAFHAVYVVPVCVVADAVLCLMEIIVAGIQAFIFTVMTALLLGMYADAGHGPAPAGRSDK